jgi:hypothetical protein
METIWVLSQPSLRSPNLLRRFPDSSLEPTAPIALKVARRWELAVLVREDDDVVLEYNQKIAEFFPGLTLAPGLAPVHVRPTPKPQEGVAAQARQILFRWRTRVIHCV